MYKQKNTNKNTFLNIINEPDPCTYEQIWDYK